MDLILNKKGVKVFVSGNDSLKNIVTLILQNNTCVYMISYENWILQK